VSGATINRLCGSGMDAVGTAARAIRAGDADMMIAGGVESMSRVPMGSDGGAWATDPAVAFHSYFVPQGISADLIATKYGYSRDDVDSYAVESQRRAQKSWDEGRFGGSIVPVTDINGDTVLAHDEHMRPQTDMQSLASLDPAFGSLGEQFGFNSVAIQRYPEVEAIEHVHHAGNSSGIVDGASAMLLGTKEIGEKLGLTPRARIRLHRLGPDDHADGTVVRGGKGPQARRHGKKRHRSVGAERGVRRRGPALHAGPGH